MSAGNFSVHRSTFCTALLVVGSNLMSTWMPMFDHLEVDLGSLLRIILGTIWYLFKPKLVPESSSNRLIIEQVTLHA